VGILRRLDTGKDFHLLRHVVVGRGPSCQLCLNHSRISGLHAELAWNGVRWTVRDLGSRNGTFVAGARLSVGTRHELDPGAELTFADDACKFRLIDVTPPRLMATSRGVVRTAEGSLLSLPDDDTPTHAVYVDRDGRWALESAAETREIADGELVVIGERAWRVHLPGQVPETRAEDAIDSLDGAELRFAVSRDEEHIELKIVTGKAVIGVEPRAHLALLLALARERLRDAKTSPHGAGEHGWVHREDLAKMLAIEPELVSLWVHRARKQLTALGLRDAAWLVERRASSTQLRIGMTRLTVTSLG
jgi:pSer/pThr/pTyr-binding forkhead associated (FHA) protein